MSIFSFMFPKPATKIADNLYLGDRNNVPDDADFVITCSSELFKKRLIDDKVAYSPAMDYIFVDNDTKLIANLDDWPKLDNINFKTIDVILANLNSKLKQDKKVYVHCMRGVNRSPSIVFIYLVINKIIRAKNYKKACKAFKKIYRGFYPLFGWRTLLKKYFPYDNFNK